MIIKTDNNKFYDIDMTDMLGGGGLGMVYSGEEMEKLSDDDYLPTGKKVAIKQVILKPENDLESAMNEVYALYALYALSSYSNGCNEKTPFVCFYGSFLYNQTVLYLVMEKIDGVKLSQIDTENPNDVYRLFEKAIDGLEIFQKNYFVHRDIKPDNIMISSKDGTLKYVDFGLGCNSSLIKNNVMICKKGNVDGTLKYIDPLFYIYYRKGMEYTANHLSDIYALASSFYSLYFDVPSYQRGDPDEIYGKVIQNIEKSREMDKRLKKVLIETMNPYGKRPTAYEIKNKVSPFSEYKNILSSLSSLESLESVDSSVSDSKEDDSLITIEIFDRGVNELMEDALLLADDPSEVEPIMYQKLYYDEIKGKGMKVSSSILQKYPYLIK